MIFVQLILIYIYIYISIYLHEWTIFQKQYLKDELITNHFLSFFINKSMDPKGGHL